LGFGFFTLHSKNRSPIIRVLQTFALLPEPDSISNHLFMILIAAPLILIHRLPLLKRDMAMRRINCVQASGGSEKQEPAGRVPPA
jgi:hypothetical protein